MGIKERLASECGTSNQAIVYTSGKMRIQKECIGASATNYNQVGDANTALLASITSYTVLGRVSSVGLLTSAYVRSANLGVALATIDIMSAASGTAVTAGTAMITTVAGTDLTANTDYHCVINTDGSQNIAAGSIIYAKIVTGVAETLRPVFVDLEIDL